MRKFSVVFFVLINLYCFSQSPDRGVENCSQILSWASNQWKVDSLGCNGFRVKVSDKFKKSQIDSVSKNHLIEKLGKPDEILRFYSGMDNKNYVGYLYFSLNMDCGHKPFMGEYVEFVFDEKERILVSIEVGDACR